MATSKKNVLSKDELAKVKLGIETLVKLKEIRLEQAFVSPEQMKAFTPWVEVALVAAALVIKVYQATKFNAFEMSDVLSKDMLASVDFKTKFSMKELLQARKNINKLANG